MADTIIEVYAVPGMTDAYLEGEGSGADHEVRDEQAEPGGVG